MMNRAFWLLLVLTACPPRPMPVIDGGVDLPDASVEAPDAGVADAGRPDAGVDAGPPPELRVRRLLPPRGPTAGGSTVLLEGSGFLRDFAGSGTAAKRLTSIRFGTNQVLDFTIIDDETMELRTPTGSSGRASVTVQNPNGRFVCNNCFTYFEELVVTASMPRSGLLPGGETVTLTGSGFTAETTVLVGAFSSPQVTVTSATQLSVVVPRGAAAGLVDITVYNQNGFAQLRRAYEYLAPTRVSSITPPTGPLAGGGVITLAGQGLSGAIAVRFGALAGSALTVTNDSSLTVQVPAGSAVGAVDVEVETPRGRWLVRNGFAYADAAGPVAVFAVSPHVVQAGQRVFVLGQSLASATAVTLGGEAASIVSRDATWLEVTVPARSSAPRRSDVVVTVGGSSVTAAAAVTWRAQLGRLTPAVGPVAGGTTVSLVGSALPPMATASLGASAVTGFAVSSETAASFTTGRGASGPASTLRVVEATDAENEAVLREAFTYQSPLAIGRVQPERGAIAGNTLVTVYGSGFGESMTVSFGAARAKDLKLVDSHTITCRTPKAQVGVVDVAVERLGQRDVLAGGFAFFDPRSISGGLSGGPLVGTLNITVLSAERSTYGAPIPQATVLLGLDATAPFQGETDERGQVTISDPSLVKAQVVTVFKENFQSVTVSAVNAENLTVFMNPTGGGEPSSGNPPPGTPPSQIGGRVTGFKAPRPLMADERLEARVFVAQTSLFAGAPFRAPGQRQGETWVVRNDGDNYLVLTGAGLRAVYAVMGIASPAGFTPVAMGVKRGVTTSPDAPATGQNIILDMALDVMAPITIDAPLTATDMFGMTRPANNSVYAWLDLGAEGFIPNPNNWGTGSTGDSSVSSTSPTLRFPHFPSLDGTNFIFMNESAGTSAYPVSYYFRRQPGALSQGITIGPMLPGPTIVQPSGSFTGTIRWQSAPGPVANIHNVQIVKPTPFGNVTVWDIVLPGTETQVVLPAPAVANLRAQEAGNQLFVVVYSSRAPRFAYNQWTYDTLSGVSWSSFTITASAGFTP